MKDRLLRVTAYIDWAQLGGTERVLLDFAERAFEHDIKLSVVTLRPGPLVGILNGLGIEARETRSVNRESKDRADILYAVSPRAQRGLWWKRGPQVWHAHRYPKDFLARLAAGIKPAAVICNSDHVKDAWLSRFTFHPSRFTVISNGVDLDRFRPRPRTGWLHDKLGLPREARLVGMPTVFQRWKGHAEVMEAFNAVAGAFPDTHLVIVGGPMYATREEITLDSELRARPPGSLVFFSGFVPKIEMVYPELDLVVHYSLKPEPFGRPVLESLACGVPVIAAHEGGPKDILRDGQTGWLIEPRNPRALAEALKRVLALPREHLTEMGKAGRVDAEDRYSEREFARRVARVLWGVVG